MTLPPSVITAGENARDFCHVPRTNAFFIGPLLRFTALAVLLATTSPLTTLLSEPRIEHDPLARTGKYSLVGFHGFAPGSLPRTRANQGETSGVPSPHRRADPGVRAPLAKACLVAHRPCRPTTGCQRLARTLPRAATGYGS